MTNAVYESFPARLPPRMAGAFLALRRKAPFRRPGGGHRPRLRVLAGVVRAYGGMLLHSHWEVVARCRCGWSSRSSWASDESPGPPLRRILRSARETLRSYSCRDAARLRATSEVMSS